MISGFCRNVGLLRYCDEWVASLFRPSEVETAEKAMANHPKMRMPENWVLYDLVFDGQSELYFTCFTNTKSSRLKLYLNYDNDVQFAVQVLFKSSFKSRFKM